MQTNDTAKECARARRKRQAADTKGRQSENYAAQWLINQGYRILGNRLRTSGGEIDLVAQNESVLAFIEVKARASERAGLEAVTLRQRRRLVAAAMIILAAQPDWLRPDIRFDLIVVTGATVHHWPAAFRADDEA